MNMNKKTIEDVDLKGKKVFCRVDYNVPFDAENAPTIYYKQTLSDGEHTFDDTLQNTTLTEETATVEVANPEAAARTVKITDANYANLPIADGTITLSSE